MEQIQQEVLQFIAKQDKSKNDLMAVSQALKKWPQEAQQFRQYCLNSKIFVQGEPPKYVYVVTKGEFTQIRYVKVHSKNPLSYISKIFAQEPQLQKQLKLFKVMDVIGMDEIHNDQYTYDVFCNSTMGEVFCIKKCVFEKIVTTMKKKNLQINIDNKPCQVIEIHSAKGATPMNRLCLGQLPRQPEEISTHRHEKRTIDFNAFRKPFKQQVQAIVEEFEEPPLNNRFLSGNRVVYLQIDIIINYIYMGTCQNCETQQPSKEQENNLIAPLTSEVDRQKRNSHHYENGVIYTGEWVKIKLYCFGSVNGVMVTEYKYGQTEHIIRDIGKMIKHVEKEYSNMLMETHVLLESRQTMVNGSMTRHMAMECIFTLMVPNTKAIGKTTNNMVRVVKHGLMVVIMKDNTNME